MFAWMNSTISAGERRRSAATVDRGIGDVARFTQSRAIVNGSRACGKPTNAFTNEAAATTR
jgi:hypothetical protein